MDFSKDQNNSCSPANPWVLSPGGWAWWSSAGAVTVLGVVLRLAAARGDLWYDEILSLEIALQVKSALEILTRAHLDNNHHLNTLYLYLLGDGWSPLVYRLPALAAGVGVIVLSGLCSARRGWIETLTTLVLVSGSYILVLYSSEARGYALAMMFGLVCYLALDRFLESREAVWGALFAVSGILGATSHLTFAYTFAGLSAWAIAALSWRGNSRKGVAAVVACLVLPLAAFGILWWADLRHSVIGGGPGFQVINVVRELLRTTLGTPRGLCELLTLPALAGATWEVYRLAREQDPKWLFFGTALVAAPLLVLVAQRPNFLAPRYFLLGVPFLLLLISRSLSCCLHHGPFGKALYVGALGLFCLGNSFPIARLATEGRGSYKEALNYMIEHTPPGSSVTVGSDHDWRNRVVLDYYARHTPGGSRYAYVAAGHLPSTPPLWFVLHNFEIPAVPPAQALSAGNRPYTFARMYPHADLSGWNWYLYKSSTR